MQEILRRKPELAGALDSRKASPLHLAAAKGYLDIVLKLVSFNPEMCFARDIDGKNPLHIAAIRGNVNILKELVKVRPQAALILMERGVTILHACVNYNQLESLRLLVEIRNDHEFVNSKDDNGNTILHLAVLEKQVEVCTRSKPTLICLFPKNYFLFFKNKNGDNYYFHKLKLESNFIS